MGPVEDAESRRAEILEGWENASGGWGRQADNVRKWGMPVAAWMIEQLALQPGQQLVELAGGAGDTGALALELIQPGGRLIQSDATEGMLEVARRRAERLGARGIEFKQLELEWIDLPTASADAVLCRFGIMFSVDPGAAAREMRRILRPGGRLALATWNGREANPWGTIPGGAMVELGHMEPPDPGGPGVFALSQPEAVRELLEEAGFLDIRVEPIDAPRTYPSVDAFVEEAFELSHAFSTTFHALPEAEQTRVRELIAERLSPFASAAGELEIPGSALGAVGDA